ncbi:MAG: hypothetical protein KAK00_06330 [Nanoarchaeota archaeon]|nr:hypothetical protein [Nanoarchaeota archaeon]
MKRTIIFVFLALLLIFGLTACQEKKPTASISTALFRDSEIKSGDTTDLILDARNTGEIPVYVKFNLATESPDKVQLAVQSSLEFTLQPGETTGNKIVKVTGVTDTISTSYLVTVSLADAEGKLFDNKNLILKVNK